LHCLAQGQKGGGIGILADDEVSLDSTRASMFGVDVTQLVILQPGDGGNENGDFDPASMEASLNRQIAALEALPEGLPPSLLVWDSLAAAVPNCELQGQIGDAHVAAQARAVNQAMRRIKALAAAKRVHVMVINQIRMKIGVVYGDNSTTPGGNAVKFAASLRIRLFGGGALKNKVGQHCGKTITFSVVKNRFAPPFRSAKVRFMFATGFDNYWGTCNHAKTLGVIPKGLKFTMETHARAVEALDAGGWGTPGGEVEAADGALDVAGGDDE
jgi:recombination protein RecA